MGHGRPTRVVVGIAAVAFALAAQSSAGAEDSEGPLMMTGPFGYGGLNVVRGVASGLRVQFIERARFHVLVLLTNGSADTVTVVDAQTPAPARSVVRHAGTLLWPYIRCSGRGLCISEPTGPYAAQLTPVTLAPGAEAGVRLNYQLGSCQDAKRGKFASGQEIHITYKGSQDTLQLQRLPIGRAKLLLQKPAGVECVPRPYSHIGLEGSFTTSPGHKPVPGSDGDTCTKNAAGGLTFRSRLFTDRGGTQFRVKIVLLRFLGRGVYGTPSSQAHLGPADVIVSGSFGEHSPTTFHGHPSVVSVTQAAGPLFGGRLEATLSGKRRFFRAYGAWRCTTKLK